MTLSQIKQSIIHGLQAYAGGRYAIADVKTTLNRNTGEAIGTRLIGE